MTTQSDLWEEENDDAFDPIGEPDEDEDDEDDGEDDGAEAVPSPS